jgi:hypothetical protein
MVSVTKVGNYSKKAVWFDEKEVKPFELLLNEGVITQPKFQEFVRSVYHERMAELIAKYKAAELAISKKDGENSATNSQEQPQQ